MSVRSLFPSVSSYNDKSLRPPPDSGDAEEDERASSSWDWGEALIDCVAYMIDESNRTSARHPFTTREGSSEELRVTFCFAPPPHVSYFCVAYTSGERTRFIREPRILATAGNLALICVKHGPSLLGRSTDYNFFVYRAGALPRLGLLPHPEPGFFPWDKYSYFTQGEVGILRHRTITCTNDEEYDDAYKIATIYDRMEKSGITHYDLFIYDSETDAWTREPTVFQQEPPRSFSSDRVVTIAGNMVWVDLSQGMILCDLRVRPAGGGPRQLRYVQLPKPVQPPRDNFPICVSTSSFSRDIAVVDDHIKFVDLEIHGSSPGLMNSWTAITWSMSVGDSEFHKDGEVKSADIASSDALDLGSFFVAHPTLTSRHGDILYLMAKGRLALRDRAAIVIAVDMKNKKVERVAKYTTQRGGSMDFAYMLTTISKYLAPPGDSKASIRKRGLVQMGEEEKEDHSKKPRSMDDHGDNMDLE